MRTQTMLVQTRIEQTDYLHLCRQAQREGISMAAYLRRLIMRDHRQAKTRASSRARRIS